MNYYDNAVTINIVPYPYYHPLIDGTINEVLYLICSEIVDFSFDSKTITEHIDKLNKTIISKKSTLNEFILDKEDFIKLKNSGMNKDYLTNYRQMCETLDDILTHEVTNKLKAIIILMSKIFWRPLVVEYLIQLGVTLTEVVHAHTTFVDFIYNDNYYDLLCLVRMDTQYNNSFWTVLYNPQYKVLPPDGLTKESIIKKFKNMALRIYTLADLCKKYIKGNSDKIKRKNVNKLPINDLYSDIHEYYDNLPSSLSEPVMFMIALPKRFETFAIAEPLYHRMPQVRGRIERRVVDELVRENHEVQQQQRVEKTKKLLHKEERRRQRRR